MHDAIIVLANLMDEFGNLNAETSSRLSTACDLLKANLAPIIVPCGWAYRDDCDLCIADAMASHATRFMGIPAEKIVVERSSRDTVGDAIFTMRHLAKPLGWRDVVVVTSAYHAARTGEIFSFVYGRPVEVVQAPSEVSDQHRASEARSIQAFRSTFEGIEAGDDEAIFQRLSTGHPFYNGQIYPKIF